MTDDCTTRTTQPAAATGHDPKPVLFTSHFTTNFLKICLYIVVSVASCRLLHVSVHTRAICPTHNDAPQSVGLLWASDQLIAETSTWPHTTLTTQTNVHSPGGIRIHNLSRRAAAIPRLLDRAVTRTCLFCVIHILFTLSVSGSDTLLPAFISKACHLCSLQAGYRIS